MHTSFILITPLVSSNSSVMFADMIHMIVNMCQIRLLYYLVLGTKTETTIFIDIQCFAFTDLRWDVIVHYVDIGEIVDHQCLNCM